MKYFKVLAVPFYIVFYKTYQKCYDICSLNPLQAIDIIEWFFKCWVLESTESFQRTSGYMEEFKWKTFKESVFTKLENFIHPAGTVKAYSTEYEFNVHVRFYHLWDCMMLPKKHRLVSANHWKIVSCD